MVEKKKSGKDEYFVYTVKWIEPILRDEVEKKFDDLGEAQQYVRQIRKTYDMSPKIWSKKVKY
jgi:hypothetical protein